jgi:hypothetical protein
METRTLLGIGQDAIPVICWQRTCLHYFHVVRFFYGRLSLKVMDELIEPRKLQSSTEFRLWHGYCWQLLASFIMRIEQSGQYKDLKNLQVGQKGPCKVEAKEAKVSEVTNTIKKEVKSFASRQ